MIRSGWTRSPPPHRRCRRLEFYRLSGDTDYLLKVLVKDIAAYDAFYRKLITAVPLSDVSSAFAMEQIKSTTALPI